MSKVIPKTKLSTYFAVRCDIVARKYGVPYCIDEYNNTLNDIHKYTTEQEQEVIQGVFGARQKYYDAYAVVPDVVCTLRSNMCGGCSMRQSCDTLYIKIKNNKQESFVPILETLKVVAHDILD